MINESIHQDIITVNIYIPNIRARKCIKQILPDIKGKIDNKKKQRPQQWIDHPAKQQGNAALNLYFR